MTCVWNTPVPGCLALSLRCTKSQDLIQIHTPVGFWSCVLLSARLLYSFPSPKVMLPPPPPSTISVPCGLAWQASHAGLCLLHADGSWSSGPGFSLFSATQQLVQRPYQIAVGPCVKNPGRWPSASSSGGSPCLLVSSLSICGALQAW